MAFGQQTVSDFAGASSDIFGGLATDMADQIKAGGLRSEAADYGLAADLAGKNEEYTVESTEIKEAAIQRGFEKSQGATQAQIAGAGFSTTSGSAQDILRSNAQQGSIAHAIAGQQGLITEAGYEEQKQTYESMQAAANAAADKEDSLGRFSEIAGFVGGGLKLAAAAFTL